MLKEYRTIKEVVGPLMLVDQVEGVTYNELVEIRQASGELRRGKVLEVNAGRALVQLFESSNGLQIDSATARFLGHGIELNCEHRYAGSRIRRHGQPARRRAAAHSRKAQGYQRRAAQPRCPRLPQRVYPDGRERHRRSQHAGARAEAARVQRQRPAACAARHADCPSGEGAGRERKVCRGVWAPLASRFEEAEYFISDFRRTGAIERAVLFMNLANDPAIERIATPRMALTAAEYLAYEKDMHVLVILTDITNYAEALREVSAARKEVPGRRGYPGYLYTDLASMYERAGRVIGRKGSITQIPILTMPEDDKTHPIPDLTGYITEGQIILSRELYRKGVHPPIDVMPSLSRLKDKGIGKGQNPRGSRRHHEPALCRLFARQGRQGACRDPRRSCADGQWTRNTRLLQMPLRSSTYRRAIR